MSFLLADCTGINRRRLYAASVVTMADTSDALVEGSYAYDPYGSCTAGGSACSNSGTSYRYTGRRLDAKTGPHYYRARYYAADDKRGGRFLQTDPVGYTANFDLYTYVGNDPTGKTDPSGEAAYDCSGDFGVGNCIGNATLAAGDTEKTKSGTVTIGTNGWRWTRAVGTET